MKTKYRIKGTEKWKLLEELNKTELDMLNFEIENNLEYKNDELDELINNIKSVNKHNEFNRKVFIYGKFSIFFKHEMFKPKGSNKESMNYVITFKSEETEFSFSEKKLVHNNDRETTLSLIFVDKLKRHFEYDDPYKRTVWREHNKEANGGVLDTMIDKVKLSSVVEENFEEAPEINDKEFYEENTL